MAQDHCSKIAKMNGSGTFSTKSAQSAPPF
jgi:hypothetical protein